MKKHLLASLILLSSINLFGAGYQLNLQGIRQMAQGGTGTAWPWDASTIFYNPAGLARLKNIQAYASIVFLMPSTAYGSNMSSARTHQQTFTPFNIYIGGPIQEDSRFALGLGVYNNAGQGMKWDDDWQGAYMVQSVNFNAIMFQPTLSYRISNFLSVGAGFVYGTGTFDMTQALPVHGQNGPQIIYGNNGQAHLKGTASGVGFNAGLHFKPSDNFQIGLTYRSQVTMDVTGGSAYFTVPTSLQDKFPNTHFNTYLPLPQVASIGIGVRPAERLTVNFDLSYVGWNSYDSLKINFDQQTDALQNMHAPRHYKNTWVPRIGANYKISKVVSVMLGGNYDASPVPDNYVSPDLPDADRVNITCGASIKPFHRFTVMAAFEGTSSVKRTGKYTYGNFEGTYKTEALSVGLGVYYNL